MTYQGSPLLRQIGERSALSTLMISYTDLTGVVLLKSFLDFKRIKAISLSENCNFTGSIPAAMESDNLIGFRIYDSGITDSVPED